MRNIDIVAICNIYEDIEKRWKESLNPNLHKKGWKTYFNVLDPSDGSYFNTYPNSREVYPEDNLYGVNFPKTMFKAVRPEKSQLIELRLLDPRKYNLQQFEYTIEDSDGYKTWTTLEEFNKVLHNSAKSIEIENNFFEILFSLEDIEVITDFHIDYLAIAGLT